MGGWHDVSDDELVTVVIPALNEERFLGSCLDSVRRQDYRNLQIVVVDGGSTDGTLDVVREHMTEDDRIELLHSPRRNIPTQLNLAVAQARGRWLVRVDAHSIVDPAYVRWSVERLAEGRWGGVGGRKDGVGHTSAGRAIAVAMASRFGVGNSTYHHGTAPQEVDHIPFGAYPVDMIRRLGGWDEQLSANEDYEFDYRVRKDGNVLLFDPAIVIKWHCRQSIRELFWQYHRYGRGKGDVARLHPESMRLRHVVPPAFVAYVVVGGLVSWRRPTRLLALLAPYGIAVTAASVLASRDLESPADRAHVPLAFAAMHVGWGLGFWSGVLRTADSRSRPASD
jgi:glycosyltransferase involved in cell wall biosynthesis